MKVDGLSVRAGSSEDVSALMAIELDAARAYGRLSSHAFAANLPVRDRDEHDLVLRRGASFVAECDGRPVGFLLSLPVDGGAHILEIAVGLEMQGRGIGTELLHAFEQWAVARNFGEATLATYVDVPWNAPFYARQGFAPFSPGTDRPELLLLIEQEKRSGIWAAPRTAMRRRTGRSEMLVGQEPLHG